MISYDVLDAAAGWLLQVRIHWTGCPNSCGQVQAADIGLMGGPAKKPDPETGKLKARSRARARARMDVLPSTLVPRDLP